MADDTFLRNPEVSHYIETLLPLLNEQQRRCFVGGLVALAGHGGLKLISEISGLSQPTLIKGRKEYETLKNDPEARAALSDGSRIRREGGGRKSVTELHPEIETELAKLLDGHESGSPGNPLTWTTKSTYTLAKLLAKKGMKVSPKTVARLLKAAGFSLRQNSRYVEKTAASPNRDEQFRFINELCKAFLREGWPVVSVNAGRKELAGGCKDGCHDLEGPGGADIEAADGLENAGIGADTAEFAAAGIRRWWETSGRERCPNARRLMITADCAGSDDETRHWKTCLQRLADETGLEIHVSHFPPGTSKWNRIEPLISAQITRCRRGQPPESLEISVSLIASSDHGKGTVVTGEELTAESPGQDSRRGDNWNYVIRPIQACP
ncbi:hypothetical protein [Sutterella sp.]|uniref:ISAzo13-like element transposase-related protein n=1 Tax=Sutterella sp. TaxID=1981025 RepID=UPI0026DEFD1B|nr:hypothetical protein [Sutterella sp.]MDO5530932.1 hypothetical protein [Sutterella sp.]